MILPASRISHSGYLYIIFLISMCLLPFSTGKAGNNSEGVGVITFALPVLILLFISIVYNFITRRDNIRYPKDMRLPIFLAFIYVLAILLTSLANENIATAFARSIFHIFGFFIFLHITLNSAVASEAILVHKKITQIFVLSGFILSSYFIINFLIAVQGNSLEQVLLERENGGLLSLPWGASNTIAGCLTMTCYSALDQVFSIKSIKNKGSIINIFMMIIIILAIIITQSRNGIIALAVGLTLISLSTKNTKLLVVLAIFMALIFSAVIDFSGQELEGVFSARVGDQAADIAGFNGRTLIWDKAVAYFVAHPLRPLGYFGMMKELGNTGHNVFLTTLIEQGVFGLTVYVLFLTNNFLFCIKKTKIRHLSPTTRRKLIFYLIAMLALLLQLQFEDYNLTAQSIIYQWVFLALMYLSAYCDSKPPFSTDPCFISPSNQTTIKSNPLDRSDSIVINSAY